MLTTRVDHQCFAAFTVSAYSLVQMNVYENKVAHYLVFGFTQNLPIRGIYNAVDPTARHNPETSLIYLNSFL